MEKPIEETVGVSYLAKHSIKDSVFTNLFKNKEYALQLYYALHPENQEKITKDEIEIVTLENVLLNKPYNDLGMTIGKHLLIMVEAQSTWSTNIVVRGLLYLAQTIQEYFQKTKQSIYKSKKVTFPEPELYVIFTGNRKDRQEVIRLSEEFFEGRKTSLEVEVKVIYDGQKGDIIYQYVHFVKVYQSLVNQYGRTQKAVLETIRICKEKDILKEYLANHEREVVDIMMSLFDKEQILTAYIEEEREEGRVEGRIEGRVEGREIERRSMVNLMLANGIEDTEIASMLKMDLKDFHEWLKNE